jgi:hypothetical protein
MLSANGSRPSLPKPVLEEFAKLIREYRCTTVYGDRGATLAASDILSCPHKQRGSQPTLTGVPLPFSTSLMQHSPDDFHFRIDLWDDQDRLIEQVIAFVSV